MTTPHAARGSAGSIVVGVVPEAARVARLRAAGEGLVTRRGPPSTDERLVVVTREGEDVAAAWLARGEDSSLASALSVPQAHLTRALAIEELTVADRQHDTLASIVYAVVASARGEGRATIAARLDGEVAALAGLAPVPGLQTREAIGAQRVDVVAHRAFTSASAATQDTMRATFVPQLVAALEAWLARFLRSAWFRAVDDGTLTREQYGYTLANLYQYVRYTTRHIAAAIAISDDRALRDHWRHHLEGEVDHERIIEKDLSFLGFDVDFVMNGMVPHPAMLQFCMAQEAVVGFRRDPVLFLAPPFVVEGFVAHLDAEFVARLERTAAGWGVGVPRHVTSFMSSHVAFDGGEDGHWAGNLALLGQHLRTERALQEFAATMALAMSSLAQSYDSFVDDLAIFQAHVPF